MYSNAKKKKKSEKLAEQSTSRCQFSHYNQTILLPTDENHLISY